MEIRDRVVELKKVRARDILPNPKNWRRHPKVQAGALHGLLKEIGIADALLARRLPDGGLQLVDGHLRQELMPDEEVPVLILDLNEAEADRLLLTLDPLAGMAAADGERLQALLDSVRVRRHVKIPPPMSFESPPS
jgi:ParB-like chromosome segregation protein Spo0J